MDHGRAGTSLSLLSLSPSPVLTFFRLLGAFLADVPHSQVRLFTLLPLMYCTDSLLPSCSVGMSPVSFLRFLFSISMLTLPLCTELRLRGCGSLGVSRYDARGLYTRLYVYGLPLFPRSLPDLFPPFPHLSRTFSRPSPPSIRQTKTPTTSASAAIPRKLRRSTVRFLSFSHSSKLTY
jgi:hypothetical protein